MVYAPEERVLDEAEWIPGSDMQVQILSLQPFVN